MTSKIDKNVRATNALEVEGRRWLFTTSLKNVPCPGKGCNCEGKPYKNIGSLRHHYHKFHADEPKLLIVLPADRERWARRPAAQELSGAEQKEEEDEGEEEGEEEDEGEEEEATAESRSAGEICEDARRATELRISLDLMVGMMSESQMRAFFKGCRITSESEISIIDAIMKVNGCSADHAGKILRRILENKKTDHLLKSVKFEGQGQRPTPVATFPTLIEVLSLIPGPEGAYIRSKQAAIVTRALTGDTSLICDVLDAGDARNNTSSMATVTVASANIDAPTFSSAHLATARQHAGTKRSRETACIVSSVTKCQRTGQVVVTSEWAKNTGALDDLWTTLEEAAEAKVPGGDDCRIVYFIRAEGTNLVKIGYSHNVLKRVKQLQTGNGIRLVIEHVVPSVQYKALETAIHQLLDERDEHVRGEWYYLEEDADHEEIVAAARAAMPKFCGAQ
jgi:hypothetical protein